MKQFTILESDFPIRKDMKTLYLKSQKSVFLSNRINSKTNVVIKEEKLDNNE